MNGNLSDDKIDTVCFERIIFLYKGSIENFEANGYPPDEGLENIIRNNEIHELKIQVFENKIKNKIIDGANPVI